MNPYLMLGMGPENGIDLSLKRFDAEYYLTQPSGLMKLCYVGTWRFISKRGKLKSAVQYTNATKIFVRPDFVRA